MLLHSLIECLWEHNIHRERERGGGREREKYANTGTRTNIVGSWRVLVSCLNVLMYKWIHGMNNSNEWTIEKCHECTNTRNYIQLKLWWQLYVMSFPAWDLDNFRSLDFCWTVSVTDRLHSVIMLQNNNNKSDDTVIMMVMLMMMMIIKSML